jgi:plastocyanin
MISKLEKKKFYILIIITFFVAASIYSCGNIKTKDEEVRNSNEVWIKNMSYIPDTLSVPAGTEVEWANQDSAAHTVTSGDTLNNKILFDSGSIGIHRTFSYKFDSAGIYHYYCKIHSKEMNGIIIVR